MINWIHTFSIGLLFSKHPVLLGEQNEREEMTSVHGVFNFKEFIYRQSETNSPESPSFLTVRCWIKPVLICKQPDVETDKLWSARKKFSVTGEEQKIRNSFRKWIKPTWKHILIPESPQYPPPKSFYSRVFWFKTSFTKFSSEETSHRVVKSSDKSFESFCNLFSSCSRSWKILSSIT